jgi:hypothetical protein
MLWTIVFILVALWLAAFLTSMTAGGLIHLLLLIALGVVVTHMILGQKPVT